ncbi:ABC transporter, ATP-binding protein [Leucobacter sp. 7(1)]|uniref:ATP-binding cassette domain-containing protein n=1 Tax=Leucobacter sp. 7(1) TaxID=1255613 RepID=UPI00097F60CF|nr:ATP-binding cassette domain-containing protein [Leucobacter sp. 7(1)]SJN10121.1 ABC transporter, ATP-binding protein [Leucobacter sp. 7(1)]
MSVRPITLDEVTVRLGGRAVLTDVSGSFAPGTITAVIGGDGAGKSVLLQLLTGRLRPSRGSISGLPRHRHELGYQAATAGVWRDLSVAENLEFVARAYGMDPQLTRSRTAELLDRAGLTSARRRRAGQLSGGMRQKLGVILATLHQPSLVILDEPSTGVDPVSRSELWTLITRIAAEGATVVCATTYLDEAERATNLILLGEGHVLATGPLHEVVRDTPGAMWEAPASSKGADLAPESPRSWRRADTVYRWSPHRETPAPAGFSPTQIDLENSSIALLLAAEERRKVPVAPQSSVAQERSRTRTTRVETPVVEAAHVGRTFGDFAALSEVSVEVRPGEIVGLLGGNGAGKTTLMRILLGIDAPTTGKAELFGAPPTLASRRRLGYVSQGLGLYSGLSAQENLRFSAAVHGVPISDRAAEFARGVGPGAVSGLPLGTQRTLAYWAAALHTPELLVLDEPTSGMDPLTRSRLWRELHTAAAQGAGVLVTTHYMQEAAQCDRLVVLTEGRVTAAGTVSSVTAAHHSVSVTCEDWQRTFTTLRAAGLPALLHGRAIRVPGATVPVVAEALADVPGTRELRDTSATLEETMLLTALAMNDSPSGLRDSLGVASE